MSPIVRAFVPVFNTDTAEVALAPSSSPPKSKELALSEKPSVPELMPAPVMFTVFTPSKDPATVRVAG
jgi:hypothetical protein